MSGPRSSHIGPAAPELLSLPDLDTVLTALGETAYLWEAVSDRIQWAANAGAVLRIGRMDGVSTGQLFQLLIAAEHVTPRTQAQSGGLHPPAGAARPYRITYRLLPGGRRSDIALWIEEQGRCWFDAQGRAVHACAVLRVVDELSGQHPGDPAAAPDIITQINRTRLTDALGTELDRCVRSGQSGAFLLASVRNLQHINDTFGFEIGEEVVAAAGRVMRTRVRNGDIIGRYSSNKFGLILTDCDQAAMRIAAERFMSALRGSVIQTSVCPIQANLVIGGVVFPEYASTVPQAIGRALEALELVRAGHYPGFCGYEPSSTVERARLRNITIADEVVSALDQDRMRLVLQPVVASKTRVPVFHEALLRMQREDGTVIGASSFVEIAEQVGLSPLLDRRTMELAVRKLVADPGLQLSFNVSGNTCADPHWLAAFRAAVAEHPGVAARTIVEITETALITDLDVTVAFVDALHELGARVAIDDFGAGYTSFRNLKHLRADIVKIDGSFVHGLATNPDDIVYLKALSDLAEACGMELVAEWVGDEPTARVIEDLGIGYMQGFLFGRPDPEQPVEATGPGITDAAAPDPA